MAAEQKENQFINLLCNFVIPIFTLKYLSPQFGEWGPLLALFISVLFPISYGIYDYKKRKNKNIWSLLGIINVLLTGGFALFQLSGIWFAVKETTIPLLFFVGTYWSIKRGKPLIKMMFFNKAVIKVDKVESILNENGRKKEFDEVLNKSTIYLSWTFLLSATLNYLLAINIFKDIDSSLSETAQQTILNNQIADMNSWSILVITVPLLICTSFILFYLFRKIKELTGLSLEELVQNG